MTSILVGSPATPSVRRSLVQRLLLGFPVLLLGGLALAAPLAGGKIAPFVLGILILGSGVIQTIQAFTLSDRRSGNAAFFGGAVSMLAGGLLLARFTLVLTALTLLLGLTWLIDGMNKVVTAVRRRQELGWSWELIDGLINVVLGLAIARQWPLSGVWSLSTLVGLRILSAGWSILFGRADTPPAPGAEAAELHPDQRLHLPPHPEIGKIRATLSEEEAARWQTDRYWRWMFILTFFAIHVGRMDTEWNLVGLFSPAVAVVGDIGIALVLAFGLVLPVRLAWRILTRGLERRAWHRYLALVDQGRDSGGFFRPIRRWLVGRMRFALRLSGARRSPTGALGRGLQVGLPLAAILIALNPIWGFNWYFNTENWVTGLWQWWAEYRTDDWRQEMVRAVRDEYRGRNIPEQDFFRVFPEGIGDSGDFSFLVIGDPGEGDASQHILRDQFLMLGQRPEVKFLVVASDVIYPQGSLKDYEPKFYLPFKGFAKPIYAVPGNHDWYDALEAFAANFFEPEAARAALRARQAADRGLTTTTEARIEGMLHEAARLRAAYGVHTGKQRAPYFEVQTDGFALLVVDTGILRRIDDDQMEWLRGALERSRGKFKMAILGHPLFAAGYYQGEGDEPFAAIHRLLREHEVAVVMAGDTHDFEYYKEPYQTEGGHGRVMHHFVNGGGGAYLSIGTALDWPTQTPVSDCAFYPRTDAVTAKLDSQTPAWKRPLWWWVKRLRAWPSSPEGMASAFDFNRAPSFQSFMEVRVEKSAGVVRLLLYGVNGQLTWRDLQLFGHVVAEGQDEHAFVEFQMPLLPQRP
jgi:uncharacterized membrane protein HdeD (DUF308 family)